ncbi:MAG: family 16 glycoside hydrolase [Planctomycetaceae bacterium]
MRIPQLTTIVRVLAVIGLLSSSLSAAEKLSLSSLFTDHAVLQRDIAVPVWGKAEPGSEVTVEFADQKKSAKAGTDGKWIVKLDPMPASAEPRELTVQSTIENQKSKITDVLVGEVWVCSGQSNMGWTLKQSTGGDEAIAAAGDGQLRLFNASARAVDEPQDSIGGTWAVDASTSATNFSGVAYFFGKELRKKLGVPVGLIKSAVGGTVCEAWTPKADLETNPTLKPLLDQQAAKVAGYAKGVEDFKQKEPELLKAHEAAVAKAKADGKPEPKKPAPPADPATNGNRPTGLYNGSIAPLVPFAIRGAIWYQGESNSGRGKEYQTLFPAMITGWRKVWAQGDFPFLFVQIAPHNGMSPEIREAQRLTVQTTQNTAMAVTLDVGHPSDIHPKDKQPVGARLALAALSLAHGEKTEHSGPAYDSMTVNSDKVTLHFKHLGGGLVARSSGGSPELKGFTIAGPDNKFVEAKATIDGDTIVVFSEAVAAPTAVRYGWSNVPEASLWNLAGLPASPFQTDGAFVLEEGFEMLLNGKDLTGWHYANGPAFDGSANASDGRYTARDGRIVVNPGKGLAQMWTTREFAHDFHLKLEFRAGVNADSGIFLRKPQLQCRDYLVAGPYKELKNYKPQDWNEIEVLVKGGVATCTCNGEELKFPNPLPATGPIGLEADRGQMEYRRIRIKELK